MTYVFCCFGVGCMFACCVLIYFMVLISWCLGLLLIGLVW